MKQRAPWSLIWTWSDTARDGGLKRRAVGYGSTRDSWLSGVWWFCDDGSEIMGLGFAHLFKSFWEVFICGRRRHETAHTPRKGLTAAVHACIHFNNYRWDVSVELVVITCGRAPQLSGCLHTICSIFLGSRRCRSTVVGTAQHGQNLPVPSDVWNLRSIRVGASVTEKREKRQIVSETEVCFSRTRRRICQYWHN